MVSSYKTPGVYIEEIAKFPPSVVPVETAIPAFIGYTKNQTYQGENLSNKPVAISSYLEYEQFFGEAPSITIPEATPITIDADGKVTGGISDPNLGGKAPQFRLAYALRHFYDNGGGKCYVISIGDYSATDTPGSMETDHTSGLEALAKEDEPTLIVFPDLSGMDMDAASVPTEYHNVLIKALEQCATLGDRFLICDLWDGHQTGRTGIDNFRNGMGTRNLKYGAAYHPFVRTTLPFNWDEASIWIDQPLIRDTDGSSIANPNPPKVTLTQLQTNEANSATVNTELYAAVRKELDRYTVTLPPAAAIAGIYATVDRTRGVWKAPANISLNSVRSLTVTIDNGLNDDMNVHTTGKSINPLRFFTGKGHLVWGARTLAGNDNEWRYVPVRRFFNMAEESIKKATEPFVFEPNDANTWVKVKAMIENFLILQWRAGALAGAKPEDAFYVRVGLGSTMTALDILEGRMNIEIGMAVVRPAEFIILKFSHKMQEA
jgi:phage tail sheath protein FI